MSIHLAGYVGEDVIIRYDPRDMAGIHVYHKDFFICRSTCQKLSGSTIGLKDIIAARNRRRRKLKNKLTDHAKTIERFIGGHKPETPAEIVEKIKPKKIHPHIKRYSN